MSLQFGHIGFLCDTQRLDIWRLIMSIRKRKWKTSRGVEKEAWVVDYTDQEGDRHIETFDKKRDADAYHDKARADVRKGLHTAPSKSLTIE